MILDTKKLTPTPKDKFEAIDFMVNARIKLTDALFIMDSILNDDTKTLDEFHKKRMKEFIGQFLLTKPDKG